VPARWKCRHPSGPQNKNPRTATAQCLKKGCHFYICNNFGKCNPILIVFSVIFSDLLLRKPVSKRSPHLKSVAALPCETWTRKCITLQESYETQYGAITFNFSKYLPGMLSAFSYVYADKFRHTACAQMFASQTHTCFDLDTPLVNGCVADVLFSAAPNVQQTLSQFVNISNVCLVYALIGLHCSQSSIIRIQYHTY